MLCAPAPGHAEGAEVVLFGFGQAVWQLAGFALGLLLLSVAIPVSMRRLAIVTHRGPGWRATAVIVPLLLILAFWFVATWPLLIIVSLSMDTYRTVGVVDGRDLVVSQHAPLNFENELDAGFRDGLVVDFDATGDLAASSPSTDITGSDWTFTVSVHPRTVVITYSGNSYRPTHGTLTLPRT